MVGKLRLHKGEQMPTNMNLKEQLRSIWGLTNFNLVAMKAGIFHVICHAFEDQSSIMSHGAVNLKSGVLRVMRWQPGFNHASFTITTSQVWIRILELPLEFRKEQNVMNIARGVGLPLKINPLTLNL